MPSTHEKIPSRFTKEYTVAKLKFSKDMENPKVDLSIKLASLEELADLLGKNLDQINDFNNMLERWVKIKNPELYESYQGSSVE